MMALRWASLGAFLLWALSVRAVPECTNVAQPVTVPVRHEAGRCIWYGQCVSYYFDTKFASSIANCYYNGPAQSGTNTDFYTLLQEVCPWYANGNETKVCCDINQLKALQNQTGVAQQMFSRCPACYRNFMHHFCATTCSPDQSLFFDIQPNYAQNCTVKENGKEVNVTYLREVDVFLDPDYADKFYNSCENVEYSQTNQKAVNGFMCGSHKDNCSAEFWLEFLGDPEQNSGSSPFLIHYNITSHPNDTSIVPVNFTQDACDNTSSRYACNCADCPSPKLCPPPPEPVTSFPYWIVSVSIAAFGFVFSLSVCILLYVSLAVGCLKSHRNPSAVHDEENERLPGSEKVEFDESTASSVNGSDSSSDMQRNVASCGPCSALAQVGAWLEFVIQSIFYKWGLMASRFWFVVIPAVLIVCAGFAAGVWFFEVTTDPVELWSAPNSRAREEKNYFDDNFGPFYRTEQVVITASPIFTNYTIYTDREHWTSGPVFFPEVLFEAFKLQSALMNISAPRYDENGRFIENVTIDDICFKPLDPDNKNCTIQSVFNYFQNSFERFNYTKSDWFGVTYNASYHIHYCLSNPSALQGVYVDFPCLAAYGAPIDPNTILGGFEGNEYDMATTMLITFIVNNHVNETDNARAEVWERAFVDHLKNYTGVYFNFSFSSERSITDELDRESRTDVLTIAVSYFIMFLYITLFLGHVRSLSTILVDLKILLGLFGVFIVVVAVSCSLGFLSYMRVTGSLIILEVVPFLVLAVGVDNLFILVHAYEREIKNSPDMPTAELVARSLARVAPSLCLTASSEAAAFLLGAISTMPAVRAFSLYAGVAVIFNFLLQVSIFVSVMYLDALRQRHNRMDVIVCLSVSKTKVTETCGGDGLLFMFMKKIWTQVVLHRLARPIWVLLFGWTFFASLALTFRLEAGLDQQLALPKDSYLQDWFSDLNNYLHIGPPVYFVIGSGYNYTPTANQDLVCSGGSCDAYSLGTQLAVASRNPDLTRLAEPPSLWLDSYFQWLDPSGQCCGYDKSNSSQQCQHPSIVPGGSCVLCLPYGTDRPSEEEFLRYLPWFLSSNPTDTCASAGHAAYGSAVVLEDNGSVNTSYAMTYHTILHNSSDYIAALQQARIIGENLTKTLDVNVFPYSVFYVYYEQYLFIVHDMFLNVGVSLGAVFLVTFALLGLNLWAAFIVIGVVGMIIVHMLGVMALLGINANAVSLVNLVMTVGIAVEFCSHITRWFVVCSKRTRLDRAHSALAHMGSSVVSGITLTKFLGVFVLYFAKSQLFQVYYFRMYISMVIIGAAHGLIFLPVLLSYIGPTYYNVKRPNPFPAALSSVPAEPVYSGNTGSPQVAPRSTFSSNSSPLYPNLPTDVNGTAGMPYSPEQQYPPPTRPKQSGRVGEKTPLLQ